MNHLNFSREIWKRSLTRDFYLKKLSSTLRTRRVRKKKRLCLCKDKTSERHRFLLEELIFVLLVKLHIQLDQKNVDIMYLPIYPVLL